MVNVHFLVTDFASHRTWIEGYQRYRFAASTTSVDDTIVTSSKSSWSTTPPKLRHDVRVTFVPGDRWKFRMMAASADLYERIGADDEILVVDAMLDVTVLVALLKTHRPAHQRPMVFLYFHENQLTTPFTSQDRDFHKTKHQQQQQTHWHYGMAHWRSLLVADGCIFNSDTHRQAFTVALPKCLNEQCPRDAVGWHLSKCRDLLATKCTVLRYGLDLDELLTCGQRRMPKNDSSKTPPRNVWMDPDTNQRTPVILWNARLEDDKNPADFMGLLGETKKTSPVPFRLIILGTDPSKDQSWYAQFREEFGDCILHMGWCQDRSEYAYWLSQASIVVSTANHETFGIAIVESVHCGALPLLPKCLSYPEIFEVVTDLTERYFYRQVTNDGTTKLINLLEMVANDPQAQQEAQTSLRQSTNRFRWDVMGPVYDQFFVSLARGMSIVDAGDEATTMSKTLNDGETQTSRKNGTNSRQPSADVIEVAHISDPNDPRVQLFRPKSLRDQREYNQQWSSLRVQGMQPALHGGRRAMVRMLEAIGLGAMIRPISFLATPELADTVLLPAMEKKRHPELSTVPVYTADKEVLNDIRGQKLNAGDAILAMVQFPVVSSLDDLLANPPILILENVRNAENVGSILRTAFCLGIRSVVASATAWAALKDSRAARCSMGTMYYHRYHQAAVSPVDNVNDPNSDDTDALVNAVQTIRHGGIRVYGIEIGDDAEPIGPHGNDTNWAAVMGNEDVGLSTRVAAACDHIVYIPQAHGDSLNVGHAASIAMFELGRESPRRDHDGLAACT